MKFIVYHIQARISLRLFEFKNIQNYENEYDY